MRILVFISVLFFLVFSGCQPSDKGSADGLDTDLKVSEIVPKHEFERKGELNVDMFVTLYQMNPNKYAGLLDELEDAQDLDFDYVSEKAFFANGFYTASGGWKTWGGLAKYIDEVGGIEIEKLNLRILEGLSEDVEFQRIEYQSNIYLVGINDIVSGIGLASGSIVMRIMPEPLIGLRRATSMNIKMIYKPSLKSHGRDFVFEPAGFNVKIQPGEFLFYGPGYLVGKESYLVSKAFLLKNPAERVQFFVVTCNRITE